MTEVLKHPGAAVPTAEPTPVIFDLETFSEADLKKCGSYVYAEHPTTRVLCAAMIINGHKIFWTPEPWNITPLPEVQYVVGIEWLRELFNQHIIVIPHNCEFERPLITITLGLPEPSGGWADTMDQTLMRGLPAGVDAAGEYISGRGKDKEGHAMMLRHCKPDRHGNYPVMTDAIKQRYQRYNLQDVLVQQDIVDIFGYKIAPEWEARVNVLHRDINHRGILLDREFAETMKSFDEIFKVEARREVERVTGGQIKGTDLARNDFVRSWLKNRGLEIPNMRQETINEVLEADEEGQIELPVDIYTVLQNRLVVTRAALAKVDAALASVCRDGRLRSLFRYWGAHTGRWSGARLQAQNMRKPDETLDLSRAIAAVENKDRAEFELCCAGKPPYVLLSSLVRSMLVPKAGCKFVVGDFSAIESRVLLWLAEDWDGLKDHVDADAGRVPDVYCVFAGQSIYMRPITKKDKVERSIGKIGELACLSAGTPVLTNFGWKAIEAVTLDDKLWDGLEWASHGGVVNRGEKLCRNVGGVYMTEDHLVLASSNWHEAGDLLRNTDELQSALDTGALSLSATSWGPWAESGRSYVDVTAVGKAESLRQIFEKAPVPDVMCAQSKHRARVEWFGLGIRQLLKIVSFVNDGLVSTLLWLAAAMAHAIKGIVTTAEEASTSAPPGENQPFLFYSMWSRFLGGISRIWTWTEFEMMRGTSPAIFVSLPVAVTCEMRAAQAESPIKEKFGLSATSTNRSAPFTASLTLLLGNSKKEKLPKKSSMTNGSAKVATTYDVVDCGPRNRFQAGPFIVHNCGYQGGVGAVQRFAALARVDLVAAGINPQSIVDAWRSKHLRVCDFWRAAQEAFQLALKTPGRSYLAGRCQFRSIGNAVEIELPSGRILTYMNARLEESHRSGWEGSAVIAYDSAVKGKTRRVELYGGKLVENCTQAVARDVLAEAMLRVAETDDIVLTVHDELVVEVPEEYADDAAENMKEIMSTPPAWAAGLPLACKPSVEDRYCK